MSITSIYRVHFLALCALCLSTTLSRGSECCAKLVGGAHVETEGVSLRMLCDHSVVVPGQRVKVGFSVQHKEGFHSYWKQPGKVGYPLQIEWKWPSLEHPPELHWDLPERVSMNGHPAHGFKRDVLHYTTVVVPEDLDGDVFVLKVEAAWLACAKNCQPGTGVFELTIPVAQEAQIAPQSTKFDREQVQPLDGWHVRAQFNGHSYQLTLTPNKPIKSPPEGVYCYSEDGQLTSSFTQEVHYDSDGAIHLSIAPASFGPKDSINLPCLLYSTSGWGDPARKYVRISPPLERTNPSHQEK